MTQRPWTHLVDEPAARHLVAVRLAPKAAQEPAALLTTLIEGLCPNGDFALLTRCGEDCAVTLCAFASPRDAEQLASAVGAEETDDYPEWASQRCFTLTTKESKMSSTGDKVKGAANEAIGKAKQGVGEVVGSDKMKVEGTLQEAKGDMQQAAGKAKDAVKKAIDND